MFILFTYRNRDDSDEYFTWYEREDRYILKNDNDDILDFLWKDSVVNLRYMQDMKWEYEHNEGIEIVYSNI
jgi:hypothetical protein